MAKPQGRDLAKEKYWRRMLRLWQRGGLTARRFCAEQQLSEASFYAWRREIARRDQEQSEATTELAPAERFAQSHSTNGPLAKRRPRNTSLPPFVKVAVEEGGSSPANVIELVVRENCVLRVRPGFDADLLRQLLRVLEEPAC